MLGASDCMIMIEQFEIVHMCPIESNGYPEEACSRQPRFLNVQFCHEMVTGMGNPLLATDNELITFDAVVVFFSQIY